MCYDVTSNVLKNIVNVVFLLNSFLVLTVEWDSLNMITFKKQNNQNYHLIITHELLNSLTILATNIIFSTYIKFYYKTRHSNYVSFSRPNGWTEWAEFF